MIEIKSLSFSFKNKNVLHNVSMIIPDGKITGLYGESGIGKTTLLKLITGLLKPSSGEISKDGKSLYENGKYDRKRGSGIGMLFQDPVSSLDPFYRIGFILSEDLRKSGLSKTEKEKRIKDTLSSLGLKEEILGHYPYQISGGEAERVAIAEILLMDSDVILMDEATSMLDSINQKSILDWIKNNYLNDERSVLLVSHDKKILDSYADRVYFMNEGSMDIREE